jgi:hypothetical protein
MSADGAALRSIERQEVGVFRPAAPGVRFADGKRREGVVSCRSVKWKPLLQIRGRVARPTTISAVRAVSERLRVAHDEPLPIGRITSIGPSFERSSEVECEGGSPVINCGNVEQLLTV